ncbi:GGDEF domain-containing protein [Neobacillus jeddahensis]|uniref:GGDEF domain-containing protein n=1 Tax=Neobacillus jeddahensis TaxID=1461580 RepID=UPI00069501E3|nr:GGDEF domain-containing protein [Neobacillus jeddahensis]
MFKQFESLHELKRSVYLWVTPCIFLALSLNILIQGGFEEDKLSFIIDNILAVWLVVSWFLFYKNLHIRLSEYVSLLIVSVYHVSTFFDVVHYYLLKSGGSLGDFIVWMPVYVMFIFLALGTKRGFLFSIAIFAITLVDGLMQVNKLPSESIDSLLQYYAANFVYIIVFFYAQQMFKAFAKAEMFKKYAYIDALTGIANRHLIDEWLEKKLLKSKEMKVDFSVIFFDIDYFKKVNDVYGHKTGDSILIELAELIKAILPACDLFGRWGGEEFIVITDDTGENASKLAELIRARIEEHDFKVVGSLTASFGVADSRFEDTIDSLLSRVDEGLYESKKRGRNQVTVVQT